jgi:predicted alpha/beta-fold hydrolase
LAIQGHLWTILPTVRHRLLPRRAMPVRRWNTTVDDPLVGTVALSGLLREHPGADAIVVVIHGLGGAPDSHYCVPAAAAAEAHGWSSLRLGLRGSDRNGHDFYHAGLTADVEAAIASPDLAGYRSIFLVGYSLGGHIALRLALRRLPERIRAVTAICSPLDLGLCSTAIDAPEGWLYRMYVLAQLRQVYAAVARHRTVPTPMSIVRRIKTLREWDRQTVVPRHGFFGVDDYYARMSVGPRLDGLTIPALLILGRDDPMVPPWTLEPSLAAAPATVEARWVDGGHVGFPRGSDVEGQVMEWLSERDRPSSRRT